MHEADRYALIIKATGVVENVILYCPDDSCPNHPTSWSPPAGYSLVKLDAAMPPINPGDIYDGKKFISVEPEQPAVQQEAQPTVAEDETSAAPQDTTEADSTEPDADISNVETPDATSGEEGATDQP